MEVSLGDTIKMENCALDISLWYCWGRCYVIRQAQKIVGFCVVLLTNTTHFDQKLTSSSVANKNI